MNCWWHFLLCHEPQIRGVLLLDFFFNYFFASTFTSLLLRVIPAWKQQAVKSALRHHTGLTQDMIIYQEMCQLNSQYSCWKTWHKKGRNESSLDVHVRKWNKVKGANEFIMFSWTDWDLIWCFNFFHCLWYNGMSVPITTKYPVKEPLVSLRDFYGSWETQTNWYNRHL